MITIFTVFNLLLPIFYLILLNLAFTIKMKSNYQRIYNQAITSRIQNDNLSPSMAIKKSEF